MRSLTVREEDRSEVERLLRSAQPGEDVWLPRAPLFVNVELTELSPTDKRNWPPGGTLDPSGDTIVVPLPAEAASPNSFALNRKSTFVSKLGRTSLRVHLPLVELRFAMTVHKLQVRGAVAARPRPGALRVVTRWGLALDHGH